MAHIEHHGYLACRSARRHYSTPGSRSTAPGSSFTADNGIRLVLDFNYIADAQPTPDDQEQTTQQEKNVADANEPAHRFELLAAENVEEVSKDVFLVGWIRVSLPENDAEVQIIPVEMDYA